MLTGLITLLAIVTATIAGVVVPGDTPAQADSADLPALSADEIAGLQYMVEEEKLAHDVYRTLGDVWGVPVFMTIAGSEATHQQAVRQLLNRYAIADPSEASPLGLFANPALQALYDELVSEGSVSLTAALRVGALIEEVDILDLKANLATTHHQEISLQYERLLNGSGNHLRAYAKQIERVSGEAYVPRYLDPVSYEEILGGANGRGRGGPGWSGGGQHGGRFGRGG